MNRLLRNREVAVAIVLALTIFGAGIVNPKFLAANNISDMLVQIVPAAIIGCGLTFVIVTGEIDISVGSLMGLLAAVLGILSAPDRANMPVAVAILATLALGCAIGFINGMLVTFGRVPSIIVTLGMLTALRGITEMVMAGKW